MNEKEQMIKDIEKQIKTLPDKAQQAIFWIVKNIETVSLLTQGEKLTEQEADTFIQKAREKEDYIMLAMILYKRAKDKEKTEQQ